MNNQAAHTGFHVPHIGGKAWKLLSSALMASTVVAAGNAAAFAQASLSKGETDNPLQASEQMTRTEVERLSHDHWLGYNLMKLAADPHIQQQLEHLHTTAEDFKIPEIKSFLDSMQRKSHNDQIKAVDEFVNQSITLDKSGSLDQWHSFREIFDRKTGDSIDYVIAKGTLLGKLGFSPEDRAIVLGSTEIGEHHAVLGVRDTSGKWNILDNRSETFKTTSENVLTPDLHQSPQPYYNEGALGSLNRWATTPGAFTPEVLIDSSGIYKTLAIDIIWGQEHENQPAAQYPPQQSQSPAKSIATGREISGYIVQDPSQRSQPPATVQDPSQQPTAQSLPSIFEVHSKAFKSSAKKFFAYATAEEEKAAKAPVGSYERYWIFQYATGMRRQAENSLREDPVTDKVAPYAPTESGTKLFAEEASKLEIRANEAIARHDYDYAERLQEHASRLHFYVESYKLSQPDAQKERVLQHQQQYQQRQGD